MYNPILIKGAGVIKKNEIAPHLVNMSLDDEVDTRQQVVELPIITQLKNLFGTQHTVSNRQIAQVTRNRTLAHEIAQQYGFEYDYYKGFTRIDFVLEKNKPL